MDKMECIIWLSYASFVILGLLIFISISYYVKTKLHVCEAERAIVRQYNRQLALAHQTEKDRKKGEQPKETFSLFNLLS